MARRRGGPNWKNINKALSESPEVQAHLEKIVNDAADEVRNSISVLPEHDYFADNTEGIVVTDAKTRPFGVVRIGGGYAPGKLTARAFENKYEHLSAVMSSKGFKQKGEK